MPQAPLFKVKIFIASDHAGFELKRALIDHLKLKGHDVEDCGAKTFDKDDDYPDFIYPCAQKVVSNPGSFGIILGASGQGEAIVANKAKGARAALFYGGNLDIVRRSKDHNDCNILSLGASYLSGDEAKEAVDLWLETQFTGEERHARRVEKIERVDRVENG
ncbi:MAG: RpiB/LacA/LacB family sugar-phosphate isomerase [Candidatus Curtissbacteria bacterium]|nr:RpiB/LacA/LacB family sugar-phosphate isomerase [Candidatus Curtissbacteria bacterium]